MKVNINITSLSYSIIKRKTGIPWWKPYLESVVLQWFLAAYSHLDFHLLSVEKIHTTKHFWRILFWINDYEQWQSNNSEWHQNILTHTTRHTLEWKEMVSLLSPLTGNTTRETHSSSQHGKWISTTTCITNTTAFFPTK